MTAYSQLERRDDFTAILRQPGRVSMQSRRILLFAELLLGDISSLLLGALCAIVTLTGANSLSYTLYPSLAVIAVYIFAAANNGSYSTAALQRAGDSLRLALSALMPAILLVVIVAFLLKGSDNISRLGFLVAIGLGTAFLAGFRMLFPRHARYVTGGRLVHRLVIVDGKDIPAVASNETVVDAAFAGIRPDLNDPAVLDRFGHVAASFDHIVVDSVPERHRAWALMLKGANIDGEILVDDADELGAVGVGKYVDHSTLVVSRKPLSVRDRMRKRALDLAITVPLLILLLPLMAFVALAVKLDSPGPVLFWQDRFGRGNRLFKMLKFRSMYADGCDSWGNRSTSRNDDRVTRVGRFIRATSIDELPQLFNVLIGDMSLVGPRPHTLGSLAAGKLFWHIDITYWQRHQLKPGITGLAQVRGFRGATGELSDLTNRLQADMEYIQGWDIWRDIVILANTMRVVVHRNAF